MRFSGKIKKPARRFPWLMVVLPGLILAGGLAILIFVATGVEQRVGKINRGAERWAAAYWQKPIPPQGAPPATHLEPARGILPENCGACHPAQYSDWRNSHHAKAMGPGVTGQFPGAGFAFEASCLECHAPLTEQWAQIRGVDGQFAPNPDHLDKLTPRGLVCAACHLRNHRRHGPPLAPGKAAVSHVIHGEPFRTPYFEASEFCKGCHQHTTTSLHINGKTVENTYREWLDSPFAGKGITCQGCHMPERRHLWKGIHDREMTRSGVTITTEVSPKTIRVGNKVRAALKLVNTGTGHAFPTYTTPAVFLKAAFLDSRGAVLPGGYYEEQILQRRLDMNRQPWGEEFDSRLLPGRETTLRFDRVVPPGASSLYLWVWVEPDHFYTDFFRQRLAAGGENFPGAKPLREALNQTIANHYLLFSETYPIASPTEAGRNKRNGQLRVSLAEMERDSRLKMNTRSSAIAPVMGGIQAAQVGGQIRETMQ